MIWGLTQDLRPGLHSFAPSRLELTGLAAVGQFAPAFIQQAPGLTVVFVAVAIFLQRGYGVQSERNFAGGPQDHGCGDQVPGAHRDDVGGEEVDVFDHVKVLGEVVTAKLAEVSGAISHAGGLHLDAHEAAAVVDADVVGERVSVGFEHVISARGGGRHELQFDPLAAFFECAEISPTLHSLPPLTHPENTKGATVGPRLFFFTLYI